ncbi:MAG: polymer-forming cytoskeletal protein [Halofilum sp. (in: g-proteobacteria)]
MSDDFRHASDADITSIIGVRDRTRGDCHVGGGLRVDGVVRGNVLASREDAALIVSPNARIEGDIHVGRARLHGHVTGTVRVDGHLDVCSGAVVEGDVRYGSMAIETGASITGILSALRIEGE